MIRINGIADALFIVQTGDGIKKNIVRSILNESKNLKCFCKNETFYAARHWLGVIWICANCDISLPIGTTPNKNQIVMKKKDKYEY